jgi:hypothetical protein
MPHHRDATIELDKLEQLPRAELRALWAKELAEKPPQSLGRDILALGIAYARQERLYGGLSRRAAKELDRLLSRALDNGNTDTPRVSMTPLPRAGTILVRHVTVIASRRLSGERPTTPMTRRAVPAVTETPDRRASLRR